MIQIKNPCDADWQQMTPQSSGKFCAACEKVVVDFSKMTDAEIKQYFIDYAAQKTCGRFLDSQLDRPLVVPTLTRFNKILNRFNRIPLARTIIFFLTSASMWISSCVKNNNEDITTTGDTTAVLEEPIDSSLSCRVIELNPTDSVKQLNNVPIKCDESIMGEVTAEQFTKMHPPQMLIGDVAVNEPDTIAVTIPAATPDTSDVTLHMIKGKVMMTDTISQKIKRKK